MTAIPPEPPEEPPAPSPFADEAAPGECPRCGTPYEPFQEYCLECGLRLPARRGVIAALAAAWRRHLPWYPGDWIWPVMLALVVAAIAAAIAILATRDNTSSATQTPATEPVPLSTGTGQEPPPPQETGTGGEPPPPPETQTEPAPAEPPPPPANGGLTTWPAGQSGWTVMLASIPQSAGRASAEASARKASGAGLTEVGVLNSSQFTSLHSGYFVVFSGVYNSRGEATSGLDTAKSAGYPQAITREITP